MDHAIATALAYHWATKHVRGRIKPHYLDFSNYPDPVKSYDFLEEKKLVRDPLSFDSDLFSLFSQPGETGSGQPLDFNRLSHLLFLAYGVTRTGQANGIPFYFRTTPSAGGLYPCHLYLMVRSLDGLETGVYYCNMIQEFLGLIHKGENRGGWNPANSFSIIVTGTFFNSAWKYRERAFRYILLDSGHLIENLSLALKAAGLDFSIDPDMDDEKISHFLSLDEKREVPLACLNVGRDDQKSDDPVGDYFCLSGPRAEEKNVRSDRPSYPLLQTIYRLGKDVVHSDDDGSQPVKAVKPSGLKEIDFRVFKQPPVRIDYTDTVIRRRSKRNFISETLGIHPAVVLLKTASSQYRNPVGPAVKETAHLSLGVVCQNVEGMEDGFYLFSREKQTLLEINQGRYQKALARVCLNQEWISNAGLNFLFMVNLSTLEKARGPRGYRNLLMASGRIAQRLYLAATGLGLGCCGVGALYDEEAQSLFSLDRDNALVYVVSTGRVKK